MAANKKAAKRKRSARKRTATATRRKKAPSSPRRRSALELAPGDFVKVLFVPEHPHALEPSGERMWVELTSVSARQCVGRLDSKPLFLRGIRYRDEVRFPPSAVLAIMRR